MKRIAILIVCALLSFAAAAKLPPLSDDAKAKAAEAAAKTAHTNKVADYLLCKSMDKVAAFYAAEAKKAARDIKPPTATPPCADPGVFAVAAPAAVAKPIEASAAHSPPTTAATPPSTTPPNTAPPSTTMPAAAVPAKKI